MELLKTSWPFDSDPNVTYDDLGYPILDRAVGAETLQKTFDKFFSDGVFSTSDFRISAASGLSVSIQPGMCIINGGMAGWWDEPKVVTLSATAPQWLTHYAIFLRYDNNDDMRGIYLRIDASAAGASVPEPVSAANVTELRIGYVTVPANATDLSGATFHNEVGTRFAPVTTPLFNIDPVPILEDLRERADEAYQAYYDLLISAVDGTTAGYLQAQIDAQGERIDVLEGQEIDPLAIREQMGLGSTGGVLQPEYGGTGVGSISGLIKAIKETDETRTVFDVTVQDSIMGEPATIPEITFDEGWHIVTVESAPVSGATENAYATINIPQANRGETTVANPPFVGNLLFTTSGSSVESWVAYEGNADVPNTRVQSLVYFPYEYVFSGNGAWTVYGYGTIRVKCTDRKLALLN